MFHLAADRQRKKKKKKSQSRLEINAGTNCSADRGQLFAVWRARLEGFWLTPFQSSFFFLFFSSLFRVIRGFSFCSVKSRSLDCRG
jgi:hypothetical protein